MSQDKGDVTKLVGKVLTIVRVVIEVHGSHAAQEKPIKEGEVNARTVEVERQERRGQRVAGCIRPT